MPSASTYFNASSGIRVLRVLPPPGYAYMGLCMARLRSPIRRLASRKSAVIPDHSGCFGSAASARRQPSKLEGRRPRVSVWLRIVVSEQFEALGGVFIDVRSVHRDV